MNLLEDEYKEIRNMELCNGVTIRQLQTKLQEIFLYFKKICEENNLVYWCGGGTMLGAIRHKGFIPWDDDLDVFLPREDYEKLYRIWEQVADTAHYALVRTDKSHNYHHTAMNLVDLTTTYIPKHSVNEDNMFGVYIDVIPFEGCPASRIKQYIQIYHSVMYSVYNVQRLPDNQGNLLKIPTKILLGLVGSSEQRYKIWKKHEIEMTKYPFGTAKYVKETITSFKGLFRIYDREIFETIEVPFEDITIKIPKGYDYYMKQIYGDYMKIPPIESMASRYGTVSFIDLNRPFIEYRGIKYGNRWK